MHLTPERGQELAEVRARSVTEQYLRAQRLYGRLISPFKGDAPPALGLAHLISVNPTLKDAPTPSKDRRRGFMFATVAMASKAGVKWEDLDDTLTCAYVWGRDINSTALSLYQQKAAWFPTPSIDFWKCAYFKHRFGATNFALLWEQRDKTQETIIDSLLYAVNALKRSLPQMTLAKQKQLGLYECPYVFELAKRGGGMHATGYGLEPVLSKNNYQQVYK